MTQLVARTVRQIEAHAQRVRRLNSFANSKLTHYVRDDVYGCSSSKLTNNVRDGAYGCANSKLTNNVRDGADGRFHAGGIGLAPYSNLIRELFLCERHCLPCGSVAMAAARNTERRGHLEL